jgi:hypothetical protein
MRGKAMETVEKSRGCQGFAVGVGGIGNELGGRVVWGIFREVKLFCIML